MTDCPDWGPDGSHDFRDEDSGEYRAVCACGAVDRAAHTVPAGAGVGDDNPPF